MEDIITIAFFVVVGIAIVTSVIRIVKNKKK